MSLLLEHACSNCCAQACTWNFHTYVRVWLCLLDLARAYWQGNVGSMRLRARVPCARESAPSNVYGPVPRSWRSRATAYLAARDSASSYHTYSGLPE